MIFYYDKQGSPMDRDTWIQMFQDKEYAQVALHNDDRVTIATVWLGLDDSHFGPPPLIFETMVLVQEKADIEPKYDAMMWRWSTEKEAKEGHDIVVKCYRENKDPTSVIMAWQRGALSSPATR